MAKIAISDLYPVGTDLFRDSEGFFDDLTDLEINNVNGGGTPFVVILVVVLLTPQKAY